jgi:hypothetical protein
MEEEHSRVEQEAQQVLREIERSTTRPQAPRLRTEPACLGPSLARRTSENSVKAKFPGELTYPIAPALMLQVAGRGIGHSLRSANISLQQEGIHHRAYLSIGVTSYSGLGYAECLEG